MIENSMKDMWNCFFNTENKHTNLAKDKRLQISPQDHQSTQRYTQQFPHSWGALWENWRTHRNSPMTQNNTTRVIYPGRHSPKPAICPSERWARTMLLFGVAGKGMWARMIARQSATRIVGAHESAGVWPATSSLMDLVLAVDSDIVE